MADLERQDSGTATEFSLTYSQYGTQPLSRTGSQQSHTELPFEAAELEDDVDIDLTSLRRRNVKGLHRIIFNFVPQWFLVTMGTGCVSLMIFTAPLGRPSWLYWISVIIYAFNLLLFVLFLAISCLRYILYPKLFPLVLRHPQQALYLGPFTVSFAIIVNMMVKICLPAWGDWMINWIWAFWFIEVVISAGVLVMVMFCLFRFHFHAALDTMLAAWLLPSISAIVAAASSGVVAKILPDEHALWTMTVGIVLWGMGVFTAFMIMAMYFHRLALNHLPPSQAIFSAFITLGPLAQGAHAIMELGDNALRLWPVMGTLPVAPMAGQVFYTLAWLVSLVFWAFAMVWLFFAVATLIDRRQFPFNLGCWGLIFPTGILSIATSQIGQEMPSKFFLYLGAVFTCINVVAWLTLCALTVHKLWTGQLFGAPPQTGKEPVGPTGEKRI